MKFGELPVANSVGAILAHRLTADGLKLKKGARLGRDDVARLEAAGVKTVIALRTEPGDEDENSAAARIGDVLRGGDITAGAAATGRVNLHATCNGLFRVDAAAVDAFNRVDPAITFACLRDRERVLSGQMIATIKIIPLAVSGESLVEVIKIASRPGFIAVRAFAAKRVGMISTRLPALKASVMDKTADILRSRLAVSGSELTEERRVAHRADQVAAALGELLRSNDMIVVFGASAVADPDDVIPAAIRLAGGAVEAVGMPVDPGNLLVLGELGGKPIVGAPGCARSPKENGFDWVLARLLAGEAVKRDDIASMGVGGLLAEIATRPQPRSTDKPANRVKRVDGVVLAAGRARRMGEGAGHKLLATFDGIPLVRRICNEAIRSAIGRLAVVTGHRTDEIVTALGGLDFVHVENPEYADGMATSLKRGIAATAKDADGALILLADMPAVKAHHLDRMIAAFREYDGGVVVRATAAGKRGNPVILPRAAFDAVQDLKGDVGARQIVETGDWSVVEVEIGEAASIDVDTPEAVRAAGGVCST